MARESTLKVVGFNIFALASVGIGLFTNYIQPVFTNDVSHLTYVIAAIMVSIVALSFWDCFKPHMWIRSYIKFQGSSFPKLGLIGPLIVLGFLVSIMYAAAQSASIDGDAIGKILISFTQGLRTSFNPTLVGIVCWYWTSYILFFTRNERY